MQVNAECLKQIERLENEIEAMREVYGKHERRMRKDFVKQKEKLTREIVCLYSDKTKTCAELLRMKQDQTANSK